MSVSADQPEEVDDGELVAGLLGRRAKAAQQQPQRLSAPLRLQRPKTLNEFPRINTNVLLYKSYGKSGLDANVAREQKELLGSIDAESA